MSQLGKSMKVHLYWAMKNCETSPSKLHELIMNIPNHYKVHLVIYIYACGYMINNVYLCRDSTPNAHPPHRAIHRPTHPVRSS